MHLGDPRARTHAILGFTALILALSGAPASAWTISTTAGGDYYQDSRSQFSRAVVAAGAMGFARGDLVVAGIRYDNNRIGAGTGVVLGGGLPIRASRLRVQGTRFIGDHDYAAWRFKVGPESGLAGGRLGVFYTRDQSDGSPSIDGATTEATLPLMPRLTARLGAGYGVTRDHAHTTQATLGAGWSPIRFIEISAEVGRAQGAATTPLAPSTPTGLRPVDGLPLIGGGGNASTPRPEAEPAVTTGLLSVRFSFP